MMKASICITWLCLLIASVHGGSLQRDVVTFINVFRHLHAAGPLLVNDDIQKVAQFAASKFATTQNKNSATTSKYSANFCIFAGTQSHLPQTCVVSWYSTIGNHQWCNPQTKGPSLPFVNMIWKSSAQVGVGVAKGTGSKFYVVAYFMLQDAKVEGNVPPVKFVMEASPKAKCPAGYSRYGTSCFKYHTSQMTWDEAIVQCAKENATLASIRNGKEETFVRQLEQAVSGDETWIGLHDRFQEGQFNWLDGLKFQPGVCVPVRATGNNKENCVAWSVKKPQGCWSDRPCSQKLPFTCRVPVEGTSTYRTEVLFKKFRWNPKFRDPNSKAYRDLIRGIKVTFNEVFTRLSGKKKAGFKKVKIKSLRPVTFPGRSHRGLAITLSVQFRSMTADPTLRFTSFLRSSEKVLSVAIDKPDKVPGKAVGAGNYCSSPCTAQMQGRCGATTTWYHPMVTCPQTCTQTVVDPCPSSCPASCCNAVYQPSSPYAFYPSYGSMYQPTIATTAVAQPVQQPAIAPSTYAPQYSSCPSHCGQYSTLDCYMHCNDKCCGEKDERNDHAQTTTGLISNMKDSMRHLKHVIKLAQAQGTAPAAHPPQTSADASVNSPTNLVQKLQAKLKVLEKRLKEAEDKYIENFENDSSSLDELAGNDENSDDTGFIPENAEMQLGAESINTANNNSYPSPDTVPNPAWNAEKLNNSNVLGPESDFPGPHLNEETVSPNQPSLIINESNSQAKAGNNKGYGDYPLNYPANVQKSVAMPSHKYNRGRKPVRVAPTQANKAITATVPTKHPAELNQGQNNPINKSKPVKNVPPVSDSKPQIVTANGENLSSVNSSEEVLGTNPDKEIQNVDNYYNTSIRNESRSPAEQFHFKEPDFEVRRQKDFGNAFKSSNSSVESSHWPLAELENSTIQQNSSRSADDFPETPSMDLGSRSSKMNGDTQERSESDSESRSSEARRIPAEEVDKNPDVGLVGRHTHRNSDNETYFENTHLQNSSVSEDHLHSGRSNSSFPDHRNQSSIALPNDAYPDNSTSDPQNGTESNDMNPDRLRLSYLDRDNSSYSDNRNQLNDTLSNSDQHNRTYSQSLRDNNSISNHSDEGSDRNNELNENRTVSRGSNSEFSESPHKNRTFSNGSGKENRTNDHLKETSTLSNDTNANQSDDRSKATSLDSKLKKSNNSMTGYYYGGMSNIDDGLTNSSSSKDEYMSAERAWKQSLFERGDRKTGQNQTVPIQSDVPSNASETQALNSQIYSIDNDKKSSEDEDHLNEGAHDPDAVSEIDGSDLFGDKSMEDAARDGNSDIDDGIIDTPGGYEDEKRNRVMPNFPVTLENP